MSDTPRTDAECRHREGLGLESGKVCSDFARELERDLATRTAERDEAREQLRLANIDQFNSEAEVAALKAQSNADAAPIPLKSWVIEVFQHLFHSPHTPDSWKRDLHLKTTALLNAIEQGKEAKP
jgi:hypothetical protein